MTEKLVVAIGGNMLITDPKTATFEKQMEKSASTARVIADLYEKGYQMIITHGNGPQVGNLLLQQQNTKVPALPLRILTAMTQTQIGVMLQLSLTNEFSRRNIEKDVVVIPTSVKVNLTQEMIENPSKPVGPFYSEEEYDKIKDTGIFKKFEKGWRKLVPSPRPLSILESRTIATLLEKSLVIAVGGGGTPVSMNGEIQFQDGVIDKDRASAVLADQIDADLLIILTNVDSVYENYREANQKEIKNMTVDEAREMMDSGALGVGTMLPKVEACVAFCSKPGRKAIITSDAKIFEALNGHAGTSISSAQGS